MIELIITDDMKSDARRKILDTSINIRRSEEKFGFDKKRICEGFLGESMVRDYFKLKDYDDYEYDTIINGQKADIKTITCKFKPPQNYLVTINSCYKDGEHRQKSDIYIFTRILNDYSIGWILGYIECDRFFSISKFIKKGERYDNILFEKANANCMRIAELHKFK